MIFLVNMLGFLKDKKGIIITDSFQTILDELRRKPNKIWVEKGSESIVEVISTKKVINLQKT